MTDKITNMSPERVKSMLAANPCVLLESGDVRTCVARASFPHLDKPQAAMEDGKADKYALTLLFPHGADISVLKQAASAKALEKWPNAGQPGGPTLHTPFRDQADKIKFDGYVAGAFFITATGERKPPVVNTQRLPIVDARGVYPGCWVIAIVRPFYFEAKNKQGKTIKQGVSFGLQSVMKIADDVELGGSGSDPNKDFAGVAVEGMSSDVDPASLF